MAQANKHHSVGQVASPWLPEDHGMATTVSQGETNTLEWLRGKGVHHPLYKSYQQSLSFMWLKLTFGKYCNNGMQIDKINLNKL